MLTENKKEEYRTYNTEQQRRLFHAACEVNSEEIIKFLLKDNKIELNLTLIDKVNAFFEAYLYNNISLINYYFNSLSAENNNFIKEIFMHYCQAENMTIIDYLLDNFDIEKYKEIVNEINLLNISESTKNNINLKLLHKKLDKDLKQKLIKHKTKL